MNVGQAAGESVAHGVTGSRHLGREDAVFAARWEHGLKMDDPDVIRSVLGASGLDAARLLEEAHQPEVNALLQAHTGSAYEGGAFGAPSFFAGEL